MTGFRGETMIISMATPRNPFSHPPSILTAVITKQFTLQSNLRRVASVIANTYCYLYSLGSAEFDSVIKDFPIQKKKMDLVAKERMNHRTSGNTRELERIISVPKPQGIFLDKTKGLLKVQDDKR